MHFDIVASAENTPYMAWQAMLFHYSCVTRTGKVPTIVVHKSDEELLTGFRQIEERGGRIQTAPNYKLDGGVWYPPRNTAGALRSVKSEADYLFLCDADMVFLESFDLEDLQFSQNEVSFDHVSYMCVSPQILEEIEPAACRAGIEIERLENLKVNGGVPHTIPASLKDRLSAEWLQCIEFFCPVSVAPGKVQLPWVATMWALVFAVLRLRLTMHGTEYCVVNFDGNKPMPENLHPRPRMIHYCYGSSAFNKRQFVTIADQRESVWDQHAPDGCIDEVVCSPLREAAESYRQELA